MQRRNQRVQHSRPLLRKRSWGFLRKPGIFVLAVGVCAVVATTAQATIVPLIGLDQMITEAELIVEGTVVDVTSRWSADKTTIYTDVTLDDLQVVHGHVAGPTVTLRFKGGEVDGYRITVEGSPSFHPGEREVLFIRGNDRAVSPVVGFFQGRFKVIDGQVHDYAGMPVVQIQNDVFVKLRQQPQEARHDETGQPSPDGLTAGTPGTGRYSYRTDAAQEEAAALHVPAERAAEAPPASVFPPVARTESQEPTASQTAPAPGVLPPPLPAQRGVLPPARKPVAHFLEPQEDTGRRLSVEEFIGVIRARLH